MSTVSEYNLSLKNVIDKHAPVIQKYSRPRKSTPWFRTVASEFLELKRERRRAERAWRKSKLIFHKQRHDALKFKMSDLVDRAKSQFYMNKIKSNSSPKALFKCFDSLLGRGKRSLPTNLDPLKLPTMFSNFFANL